MWKTEVEKTAGKFMTPYTISGHKGSYGSINEPTNLSSFFDACQFAEGADEQAYDEMSDPYGDQMFAMTIGQETDLQVMVRTAIDVWQEKHRLEFLSFMFSDMRNEECVESDRYKRLLVENVA